jgi:hypothetical protein
MGGDLNLKKSWHPVLMSNQRRVWEEEKKALEERKRIEQMVKERQEERQIQELQEMQEAAGGKKRLNRVDWMYSGPSSGQAGTTEEMEGYLLGKRRIDGLLKNNEHKKLEKAASEESFMALQHANTVRDTAAKIRDDPMLAIKKQEQAAYEAMMNDPVARRMLLKAAGGDLPRKDKKRKHRKDRHHHGRHGSRHHHHRDESESRDKSHKRRRLEDGGRESIEGDRRESDIKRRRASEHDRNRRGDEPRESEPRRWRNIENGRDRHDDRRHRERRRSDSSSDSRSPPRNYRPRRSSPLNHRSKSPERDRDDSHQLKHSKSWHAAPQRDVRNGHHSSPVDRTSDDRAAKLLAMQQAASELDGDREKRIQSLNEKEEADREAEEAARAKAEKYGGKGDFVTGLHRKAGDLGIGERLRRGRGGLEKDRDEL